jgi:hypothetical protein
MLCTRFTAGRFIRVVSKTVEADGTLHTVEYRVAADGKDVPVKGSPVYDTLSVERVDATMSRATRKKNGKIVQISTRVLSEGGSTMTITTMGTDQYGRSVHDVTVFERQ